MAADTLDVWVNDSCVAVLERSRRGDLALTYSKDSVARFGTNGLCLSMALPVRTKAHLGRQVEWWTEGLLPEGEARTVIEDLCTVRRGDTFALLHAIGKDCAGAVSFHPLDEPPLPAIPDTSVSDDELHRLVADLPMHPLGVDVDVPVSLAGLQAKLLMVRTADGWARPSRARPSTHILKPDPFERPGLIAAEALTMTAAKLAGFDVADITLDAIGGRDVLIVSRFDRLLGDDGVVRRVHQEDGCQALGINPVRDLKYQRQRRSLPSYEALAGLLLDHAVDPVAEQAKLAQSMVLTVAAGNTDGHARNHSFLIADGVVRLSPIYDAAPTIEFSGSRRMGLWVCGQELLEHVTSHHLRLEAGSWTPLRQDAADLVADAARRLVDAFGEAATAFPQVPAEIVERMQQRAARLVG
jgi:serine/threonine-protein kinase HipA